MSWHKLLSTHYLTFARSQNARRTNFHSNQGATLLEYALLLSLILLTTLLAVNGLGSSANLQIEKAQIALDMTAQFNADGGGTQSGMSGDDKKDMEPCPKGGCGESGSNSGFAVNNPGGSSYGMPHSPGAGASLQDDHSDGSVFW